MSGLREDCCCAPATAGSASSRDSAAMCLMPIMTLALLRCARQRDAELADLSVQIGTLDPQGQCRVGHAPLMMLQHGDDIVAFEPLPRLAQVAGWREYRRCG